MEVVERIVHQVTTERFDREIRAVTSPTCPFPLFALHPIEAGSEQGGAPLDLLGNFARVLRFIAMFTGRFVLIPVREGGVVLFKHHLKPAVVQQEDVADMARIFQTGPPVIRRTNGDHRIAQESFPLRAVLTNHVAKLFAPKPCCFESTLRAPALEDPGPVLRVGNDGHALVLPHQGGRPLLSVDSASRMQRPSRGETCLFY
jgi:hypothetical protein